MTLLLHVLRLLLRHLLAVHLTTARVSSALQHLIITCLRPLAAAHVVRRQHEEETQEDDLYYYDEVHPQDRTGHKALADLLIYLTQETARGLAARPLGDEDEEISKVQGVEHLEQQS